GERLYDEYLKGRKDHRAVGRVTMKLLDAFAPLRGSPTHEQKWQKRFVDLMTMVWRIGGAKRGAPTHIGRVKSGTPNQTHTHHIKRLYARGLKLYPPRKGAKVSNKAVQYVRDELTRMGVDCRRIGLKTLENHVRKME